MKPETIRVSRVTKFGRPKLTREPTSLPLSTLDLSECRRCHQRNPLPFVFESPNGHVSLRICVECAAILELNALEDTVNHS